MSLNPTSPDPEFGPASGIGARGRTESEPSFDRWTAGTSSPQVTTGMRVKADGRTSFRPRLALTLPSLRGALQPRRSPTSRRVRPLKPTPPNLIPSLLSCACLVALAGCSDSGTSRNEDREVAATAESCMSCHNGSAHNDYAGPGMENPHPFNGAATITCTGCHGGNGNGTDMLSSHVPPPPEIGDRDFQDGNAEAYFNRLTQVGLDKYANYTVDDVTYSPIDYIKFINPGDLRVTTEGEGCGSCHAPHSDLVSHSLLATSAGILSGALYAIGVESVIPDTVGDYQNTASDLGFRPVIDPDFVFNPTMVGAVPELAEFPVFSVVGQNGADDIFQNPAYDAALLSADIQADGRVVNGSPLANLFHEQVAFTCGNCHLGSAGANNRYGDFRSSGCTACHMRYALDGRDNSTDPNINKLEPANVDNIQAPERPHVDRHLIKSVSRTLQTGETVPGIDDYTCAGCHQGSNRTVMQFWGIRLDQNQDLFFNNQYPTAPVSYTNTANDTRLFDPVVNNNTFNGRNARQYILTEDYDGDGRDDTPPDVHYAAGMGCIDCHGSHDLHGGSVTDPNNERIYSRQEQSVAIQCEDCHGTVENYATTAVGADYNGALTDLVTDREGNLLRHVRRASTGEYYLTSRLTGNVHYVPQIRDVVVPSTKTNPLTGEVIFNEKASYAMGTDNGDSSDGGIGPKQTGIPSNGFSHMDNMSCVSCHASWTNNCIGCHLKGEYDNGQFSNITGERIIFNEANADFVYQSPVPFQLGVDTHGKISPIAGNTDMWFQWFDEQGDASDIFTFSNRNAQGANPGQAVHPAMNHNAMMPHSIRGKVDSSNEGPRYCVACHLTDDAITNFGTQYDAFRTAMATNDFASLDYTLLANHIGANPGNQLNSPFWVHMVSGLGSGLFLFNEDGGPVNPIDNNANRFGAGGVAPSANFNPADVRYNLDRIVNPDGSSAGGNNHVFLDPSGPGPALRDGATNPLLAGPLGATILEMLTDPTSGVVLDSWINADGTLEGDAPTHVVP